MKTIFLCFVAVSGWLMLTVMGYWWKADHDRSVASISRLQAQASIDEKFRSEIRQTLLDLPDEMPACTQVWGNETIGHPITSLMIEEATPGYQSLAPGEKAEFQANMVRGMF